MAATDGTLVLGALHGDQGAFAELYDRRARLIRAACFDATHDLEVAAELTQEVFLRAMEHLSNLRDPQRFTPWLIGIARQVCREWRRGRWKERHRLAPLPEPIGDEIAIDAEDDRIAPLRDAMGALPEKERLCVQAVYLSGLDAEQARAALGVSLATLYRILARARARLETLMRRQEVRP